MNKSEISHMVDFCPSVICPVIAYCKISLVYSPPQLVLWCVVANIAWIPLNQRLEEIRNEGAALAE